MITATCAGRRSKLTCRASPSSADPGVTAARTSSRLMGLNAHHNKSVIDLHQEEAPGGRRPPRLGAVRRGQQARDIARGALPPSYLDHGADQAPHHVPEKPLAGDFEDQGPLRLFAA